MGVRRFRALLMGLPWDSCVKQAFGAEDPTGGGWGNDTELLKLIAELLDRHTRTYIAANTKRGKKGPDPVVINRPDRRRQPEPEPEAPAGMSSRTEVMAFFGASVRHVPVKEAADA